MIVVLLASRAWLALAVPRLSPERSYVDTLLLSALVGVAVGRLAFVGLDDPAGFAHPRDLLILRGGVDVWPGLLAAAIVFWLAHRRGPAALVDHAADVAPVLLVAAAAYEGTCGLRGGCVGPISAIGLRPTGILTTMFPVGLAVALGLVAGAIAVYGIAARRPALAVTTALLIFAAIRGVAGFFLPRVGDGLTRPHVTSIAAVGAALVAVAVSARVPPTPSSHNDQAATTTGESHQTS